MPTDLPDRIEQSTQLVAWLRGGSRRNAIPRCAVRDYSWKPVVGLQAIPGCANGRISSRTTLGIWPHD